MRRIKSFAVAVTTVSFFSLLAPAFAEECATMDQLNQGGGAAVQFNAPFVFPSGTKMDLWISNYKNPAGDVVFDKPSFMPESNCGGSTSSTVLHTTVSDLYGRLSNPATTQISFKVCAQGTAGNLGAEVTAGPEFIGDLMSLNHQPLHGPFGANLAATTVLANGPGSNGGAVQIAGPSVTDFIIGGNPLDIAEICIQ